MRRRPTLAASAFASAVGTGLRSASGSPADSATTTAFAQSQGDNWLVRGGDHLKAGRTAEAMSAYEKAWDLGANGRFVAGYNLACLQARAGHPDEAFAWPE